MAKRKTANKKSAGAKKKPKQTIVTSQIKLATKLKTSKSTIQKWVARGMPGRPGHYVVEDIVKWRNETFLRRPEDNHGHIGAPGLNGENGHATKMNSAKLAKLEADVEKAEADAIVAKRNAQLAIGQWIRFEDCQNFHSELCLELRRLMERIPIDGEVAFGGKGTNSGKFAKTWLTKRHEMILTQLRGVVRNLVNVVDDSVK